MDRAVGVLRNSKLGPPFRRWQDQVTTVIRLRFTAQKVARRLMHRSMSAAFEGWLNSIDQAYRLIYLANKVVKRMALLALGQAFTGWASAAGQSTRTRTTVTRAVKRLKDRELTAAWDSWIAAHKKRLENQVAVQRTLAKMLNRALSAAFDAWNSFFRDKKRLRHLGQKCVKGFKAALQRSAFNTWGQATIAHMYALEPRYLLLAMRSPHDRRRFPTPHSGIFAQVESQVHIPLPSVLEACVALTRDVRVLRMEAERLDTLMNQTARKIMHLAMASGFKTWKSQFVEAKAERTRLDNLFKKVVGRFKNKALAAAWAAWKQHVEESQRLRGSAHKVVARMTRVKMAGAFAGWAESFNSARAQQATAAKVLGRICNMKMAAALSGWQSALTAAKTRRTILTRVLAKMLNRCMSAAFDSWLKQTLETKRLQSQLRKIVLKFKNAALSRAYEGCAPPLHIHQATEFANLKTVGAGGKRAWRGSSARSICWPRPRARSSTRTWQGPGAPGCTWRCRPVRSPGGRGRRSRRRCGTRSHARRFCARSSTWEVRLNRRTPILSSDSHTERTGRCVGSQPDDAADFDGVEGLEGSGARDPHRPGSVAQDRPCPAAARRLCNLVRTARRFSTCACFSHDSGLSKSATLGQVAWDAECAERAALVRHAREGRGAGGAGRRARRGGGDQRQAGRRAAAGALPNTGLDSN